MTEPEPEPETATGDRGAAMTGCDLCGVGPDDECSMDCPSRYVS